MEYLKNNYVFCTYSVKIFKNFPEYIYILFLNSNLNFIHQNRIFFGTSLLLHSAYLNFK